MECGFIFAGFGGQGVLFLGKVVAYVGLLDAHEVSWLPSYGPEMRGGTANCSVCISDVPIGSPLVTAPDILVAMNGPPFDKFIGSVVPGGKVFIDSSLVEPRNSRRDIELYELPVTAMARENSAMGMANMILLGKVLAETQFSSYNTMEQAIQKCVPVSKQHLLEKNLSAIHLGMLS